MHLGGGEKKKAGLKFLRLGLKTCHTVWKTADDRLQLAGTDECWQVVAADRKRLWLMCFVVEIESANGVNRLRFWRGGGDFAKLLTQNVRVWSQLSIYDSPAVCLYNAVRVADIWG